MGSERADIYQGRSPVELGAYSVIDAARFLQLPESTVRSWVSGRWYPTRSGKAKFSPIIHLDDRALLSFRNLVEVHVLSALRRQHQVRLDAVRKAIKYVEDKFGTRHPLAEQPMFTASKDVFIERYGSLINASREGQLAMSEILAMYLERVKRNARGAVIKLFPFASERPVSDAPRVVAIDPTVNFGRPSIDGKGVPTAAVADRYKAGESIGALARDFSCTQGQIEEAVRYEFHQWRAAA